MDDANLAAWTVIPLAVEDRASRGGRSSQGETGELGHSAVRTFRHSTARLSRASSHISGSTSTKGLQLNRRRKKISLPPLFIRVMWVKGGGRGGGGVGRVHGTS